VATNIADVNIVAGISANVTTVATDSADINTIATNIADVNTVAGNTTNINTVAGISSDVTTVAGISADVVAAPTFASDAQSARDQAQAARDTANLHKLAAEAAATSATNTASSLTGFDLAAIAATKAETAVDVFVYDTANDSDGGAWRKRTQNTSWYQETLNTATRGARREFPAVAVIVAEADKVTIYDGDDPALPMWMVFLETAQQVRSFLPNVAVMTSVAALNGVLCIGTATTTIGGISGVEFVKDILWQYDNIAERGGYGGANVAERIEADLLFPTTTTIVSRTVNDVAMTVLPDAPIDPATGLPVPTIAVATAGGVSVITDSGTVYDSAVTLAISSVSYNENFLFASTTADSRGSLWGYHISEITADGFGNAGFWLNTIAYTGAGANGSIPSWRVVVSGATNDIASSKKFAAFNGAGALQQVTLDGQNPTKALLNQTTSTYNTGWMNGDIKGAFLSDTDDTDLVASGELVTNGTFDTDTTGWSRGFNSVDGTFTATGGVATYIVGAGDGAAPRMISTAMTGLTIGQTYLLKFSEVSATGTGDRLVVWTSVSNGTGGQVLNQVTVANWNGEDKTFTVIATATTMYVAVAFAGTSAGSTISIDNVSVKLADADRSVNNKGLVVNGTVTRSPVATGADLVAYSGFSASNYLEQPYNSALDFGTGDFCINFWHMPITTLTQNRELFGIYDSITGARVLSLYIAVTGILRVYINNGIPLQTADYGFPAINVWNMFSVVRTGGVLSLYRDGQFLQSTANTTDITAASTNVFRIGVPLSSSPNLSRFALIRISATAPTADQVRKIYEDEKFLFQDNAQATLFGASDAVTALAHDPVTDLLHVGTSAGRSVFQGLRRVSNTTTAVGTAISASNGLVVEE
jgi:hypothetical protein